MKRFEPLLFLVVTVIEVSIGGCSLVVDFDRSLLVDAAVDASFDGGVDAAVDAGTDAEADAN